MQLNLGSLLGISLILILSGFVLYHYYFVNIQKDSSILKSTCSKDSLIFNNDLLNKYCSKNYDETCKLQNRIFNLNILKKVCNNNNYNK